MRCSNGIERHTYIPAVLRGRKFYDDAKPPNKKKGEALQTSPMIFWRSWINCLIYWRIAPRRYREQRWCSSESRQFSQCGMLCVWFFPAPIDYLWYPDIQFCRWFYVEDRAGSKSRVPTPPVSHGVRANAPRQYISNIDSLLP